MKILLTGAGGLIGSMLYNNIKSKYAVTALKHRSDLDLMDSTAVAEFFNGQYFDCVIHCAIAGAADIGNLDFNIFRNNWTMYANIQNNRSSFGRLINIGSGCEMTYGEENTEQDLYKEYPDQPYGMSKNMIARDVLQHADCYNLRLYGTVGKNRIFNKIHDAVAAGEKSFTMFNDKQMDYIHPADLLKIINYYIQEPDPVYQDINMVYDQKTKVSQVLQQYITDHGLPLELIVDPTPVVSELSSNKIRYSNLDFIGNGARLKELEIL
jgi:nucleoside-diphosphate-sugar epimerase